MKNPNLLFLICDQLQRNVLDIYGGPVTTGAWSKLAERGIVFERFYCASPLCVPTRSSMMTGRWPHAHGSISHGGDYWTLNNTETLLIDQLNENGFHVGYDGIWHIYRTPENDHGKYAHFRESNFGYEQYRRMCREQGLDPEQGRAKVHTPSDNGEKEWKFSIPVPVTWTGPIEEHPDTIVAANIADFILSAPHDKPFAAWCSIGAPHPPFVIPREFSGRHRPEDMKRPAGMGENMSALPNAIAEYAPGRQAVRNWNWEQWAKAIAAYYDYTAFADSCMTKVLDALEESGQADNTIIVATADHGEMLGAHNLYQKAVLYDRACRLPLIISGPGLSPGRRGQLASHVDLAPTLSELLEVPPLPSVQGKSLLNVLKNTEHSGQEYHYFEFNGHVEGGVYMRGIVSERFKYMYHHNDKDMLFDLQNDPEELNNLANRPEYSDIVEKLKNELKIWMLNTGDFIGIEA